MSEFEKNLIIRSITNYVNLMCHTMNSIKIARYKLIISHIAGNVDLSDVEKSYVVEAIEHEIDLVRFENSL